MRKRFLATFTLCTIVCTILTPTVLMGAEQFLYKWVDPDGTMTFSPTPPPKSSGIAYEKVKTGGKQSAAKLDKALPTDQQFVSKQRIPAATPIQQREPLQTNRKSAHCAELRKRVVSLERLMKTEISAETMDNAVLQMAKYQASFNQSCNKVLR